MPINNDIFIIHEQENDDDSLFRFVPCIMTGVACPTITYDGVTTGSNFLGVVAPLVNTVEGTA